MNAIVQDVARLDATQLYQLHHAIMAVAKHLPHHPAATMTLRAWIRRQHNLRKTQDLPAEQLPAVLAQLEEWRGKALDHCVALWSLEKQFIYQTVGVHYNPDDLLLEMEEEAAA